MTASAQFERLTAHGFRWVAEAGFVETIRRDARVIRPGGADIVKAGPARRVWRFRPDGAVAEVYVKENLLAEMTDTIKYLFGPAKAVKEWRMLLRLRERGVSVPRPLAVGVRRRGPILESSVLVTEALGEVEPLVNYFAAHASSASHAEVAAFTESFAGFVRRLHEAGVVQRDFHAGNIMVEGPPDDARFHLLDLYDVRIAESVPRRKLLKNLAVLGHFFCRTVPRHWRARFLREYMGGRGESRDAARIIERRAERGMRKIWARRDKRIFSENKYFRHVGVDDLLGHRRRTEAGATAVGLFTGGGVFDAAQELIKDSRSSTIGLFKAPPGDGERTFMVKRRNPRGGWKSLFDPFRTSRGKKGFYFGAAFENRHLPTPRVFAALDERRRGRIEASYLVLEYIEGAENLGGVLAAGNKSAVFRMLAADRRAFADRLARTLRRMHWCGFSMRDLKAANVLLYESEGRLEHAIIDLDGVRQFRAAAPERLAIRNLARLYFDVSWLSGVTRREAMEFLKAYLGPAPRAKIARWVSGIAAFVREKRGRFTPKGVFRDAGASTDGLPKEGHNG